MKKTGSIVRLLKVVLVGFWIMSGIITSNGVFAKMFTVSPMSQSVILVPGETYKGGVTIANPAASNSDFNYEVVVAPFSLEETKVTDAEPGGANFDAFSDYNQIVDWITLDNPEGTVSPNEQVVVSFSIKVPNNAPAGGQYASLLVRESSKAGTEEDGLAIKEVMQMAHIVYAEVAGETIKKGEILENNIPAFLFTNRLQATSTVKNNGNVHAEPEYILQVFPLIGDEEIYTNEESPNKSSTPLMPGVTKYHNEECNLPAFGIFRVKQTVKIFGEVSIMEKTIIVCPLWLLFIIILAIVGIIIWLIFRTKSRKNTQKATE